MLVILLWIAFTVSAGALAMTIWNLTLFGRSSPGAPARGDSVTVCIPARNEQENIEACIRAVLASDHAAIRVLVYDDHSTDETGPIVRRLGNEDPRVVACPVRMLPEGWIGKQHACDQLGRHAQGDWLLFIDADVRLSPDCIRRALDAATGLKADLLSTFPRQITDTLAESLLVPMIHFVLLSYLPFVRMRRSNDPAASAACGQFILVRREAYRAAGGHERVRDSMHDGVKLPRVFRKAGFHTDLFDGTDVASCRMYTGPINTWRGFAKNAYEGLGSVGLLLFLTALHLIGHVLPWGVLVYAAASLVGSDEWLWPLPMPIVLAAVCAAMHLIQRAVLANRFRQGLTAVMLHPVGITLMTLVQWHSFVLHLRGRRSWRGRDAAVSRLSGVPAEGVRR